MPPFATSRDQEAGTAFEPRPAPDLYGRRYRRGMFPIPAPFRHSKRDKQDSMVQMTSLEVLEAARNTLERITIRRAEAERELITATQKAWNKSWWNRLWKRTYTYKEVAQALEPDNYHGFALLDCEIWMIRCIRYSEMEDAAKRLLRAASYGKDVWVCTKDLELMA